MNAIVKIDPSKAITMTSLELVEFINSERADGDAELRHDHFMAKVPKVLGEIAAPKFRGSYQGRDGTTRPCYRFSKREACLMAMSYSYDLQAKVFDRMTLLEQELAAKQAFVIPKTMSEALRLAADLAETVQSLQIETANQRNLIEVVQPKADAFDMVAAGKDTMTITESAKVLGKKRVELTAYLHEKGWIYRQNGSWVAYDQHIRTGCLQYKEATYTDDKTGMERRKPYCHITPKGMTKLALMLGTGGIELKKAA